MRWTEKEDEIVVRYYLRHVYDWSANMSELMFELQTAGYPDRDKASARMRVGNVESIHTKGARGLSNSAKQTLEVYHKVIFEK